MAPRDPSAALLLSRRLAYVLRHDPASVGVELDAAGWVDAAELLEALARHGFPVTTAELAAAVEGAGKRRFAFDVAGVRVRALQGHSVEVALGLEPVAPPAVLFHGTTAPAWAGIAAHGLLRGSRQHVHLSADEESAALVGGRRAGELVLLAVDAAALAAAGHVFFRAENGVWLTDHVPPCHLTRRA